MFDDGEEPFGKRVMRGTAKFVHAVPNEIAVPIAEGYATSQGAPGAGTAAVAGAKFLAGLYLDREPEYHPDTEEAVKKVVARNRSRYDEWSRNRRMAPFEHLRYVPQEHVGAGEGPHAATNRPPRGHGDRTDWTYDERLGYAQRYYPPPAMGSAPMRWEYERPYGIAGPEREMEEESVEEERDYQVPMLPWIDVPEPEPYYGVEDMDDRLGRHRFSRAVRLAERLRPMYGLRSGRCVPNLVGSVRKERDYGYEGIGIRLRPWKTGRWDSGGRSGPWPALKRKRDETVMEHTLVAPDRRRRDRGPVLDARHLAMIATGGM